MESIMKNTKIFSFSLALAAIFTTLFVVGCGTPQPRSWNLVITKSTSASIEVDLIGVRASGIPVWEGYNLDQYWSEGNLRRKEAKPMSKILEKDKPWLVSATEAQWQEWMNHGATHLLIMANLPGHFEAGASDPRRLFLPLADVYKSKNHTLEIEVQGTMISLLTPQKAK